MASHDLATIDNPSAALTDFTLIVDLSGMSAGWWTAQNDADGTKGRVYKGDGTTELACDWIDFDGAGETGLLRVKWSGTLATTGTQQLWIEPPISGNAAVAANATYGSDNAYDSSWEAYYPLEEDPSGSAPQIVDRTSNSRDLTSAGAMTSGDLVPGQIGNGIDFDGTDDVLSSGAWDPDGETTMTLMGWVAAEAYATGDYLRVGWSEDGSWGHTGFALANDNGLVWRFGIGESSGASRAATVTTGTVYHAAITKDGTAEVGYVSGSTVGSYTAGAGTLASNANSFRIGQVRSAGDRWATGVYDEIQVHSVARSADWIASEYAQTNDNANFYTSWTWVAAAGGIVVLRRRRM